ncbi:hypothetical protein NV381_18265 [Paenibacillus sp. N5-1-1-5]|uniref:Uncharacterized protein n=1 Tax=Paenibacillus radicis (ex Xue et al. 2023) TaxID=2972489 RepID=A0ABT1YMD1_9BACL|nr:hypothetical protein [Paenibacillus radicis (ex Xue et al. 2023)]
MARLLIRGTRLQPRFMSHIDISPSRGWNPPQSSRANVDRTSSYFKATSITPQAEAGTHLNPHAPT